MIQQLNCTMQQLCGKLITFEGVDFAGKTTQIAMLKDHLDRLQIPSIVTHQPHDPNIRSLILSKRNESNLMPVAELLLYMADRTQHCKEVILPNLKNGKVVLCDRFVDSSVAYQGYGKGIDIEYIDMLNSMALDGLQVDATIFLDVDRKEAANRRQNQVLDKMESLGNDFFDKVNRGFVELCSKNSHRMHRVDGTLDKLTVHRNILEILHSAFRSKTQSTASLVVESLEQLV